MSNLNKILDDIKICCKKISNIIRYSNSLDMEKLSNEYNIEKKNKAIFKEKKDELLNIVEVYKKQWLELTEELKVKAMEAFVSYIKGMAGILNKRAFIKNEISNNFIPKEPVIGFSDDDLKNVEVVKKHFEQDPENIIKTYSTAGGIKKEY